LAIEEHRCSRIGYNGWRYAACRFDLYKFVCGQDAY